METLVDIRTLLIFSGATCLILAVHAHMQTKVFSHFRAELRWLSLCMLFGALSLLGLAVTTGELSALRTLCGYVPGVISICFSLLCVSALYRDTRQHKWAITVTVVFLIVFFVFPAGQWSECWLLTAETIMVTLATVIAFRGQEPEAPAARKMLLALLGGYALNTAVSVAIAIYLMVTHGIAPSSSPIETTTGLLLMWAFAPLLLSVPVTTIVHARVAGKLKELADFDGLTGFKVRRRFFEEAKRIIDRKAASGGHLAIMMIDLDHFKDVNDRYGHAVGDAALQHCAELIRSTTRAETLIGRYGGEEFCALTHVDDRTEIDRIAERIRATIAATPLMVNNSPIALTVSIGVAFHEPNATVESLLVRADHHLYAAKRAGRNRIISFDPAAPALIAVT